MIVSRIYLERSHKSLIFFVRPITQKIQLREFSFCGTGCTILIVPRGRGLYKRKRLGCWRRCTISLQGVGEISGVEEGVEVGALEGEVPEGAMKRSQKIVSGVVNQTTGVGSVRKRTVCAHGVQGWVILNLLVTARKMERQRGGNLVFKGVEAVVQVVQEEVDMGDMGKAWRRRRSKDTRRCWLGNHQYGKRRR